MKVYVVYDSYYGGEFYEEWLGVCDSNEQAKRLKKQYLEKNPTILADDVEIEAVEINSFRYPK